MPYATEIGGTSLATWYLVDKEVFGIWRNALYRVLYRCCAVDFINHLSVLFSFSFSQIRFFFFNRKIEIFNRNRLRCDLAVGPE
jgi:hypothetical protein